MAELLNSLFCVFSISFLLNYRLKYIIIMLNGAVVYNVIGVTRYCINFSITIWYIGTLFCYTAQVVPLPLLFKFPRSNNSHSQLVFVSYREAFNDMGPEAVSLDQHYRPRVYRYDVSTGRYELLQLLDPQSKPMGSATFTSAGRHYIVVQRMIYVFNSTTGK